MSVDTKELEELIRKLPVDIRGQVIDYAKYLLSKRRPKQERKLSQKWAGALSEYRNQYTSLELQKTALDWRGD